MGFYFKTSEHTAAGISWPTYIFLVAPVQALYGFLKLILFGFKWLLIGIAALTALAIAAVRAIRERDDETARPST